MKLNAKTYLLHYVHSLALHVYAIVVVVSVSILNTEATLPDDNRAPPAPDNGVQLRRWHTHPGFHRDLTTEIQVRIPNDAPYDNCVFLLIETLPRGMYVDMDQIYELANWGGPLVLSEKPIDVEKPEYLSPQHTIYIFSEGKLEGELLKATVTIPIHMRYHRPSNRLPQAKIILRRPRVLGRCSGGSLSLGVDVLAPCDHTNGSICSWVDLQYTMKDGALQAFTVPVGRSAHIVWVCIGTTSVTIIGALVILYTMFNYPQHDKCE